MEDRKEEQVTAVLALLNMGIKTVPEAVLKTKFNEVALQLLHILKDYSNSENNTIIKSVFGILSVLLRMHDRDMWSSSSLNQIFQAILNPFCVHSKPKVSVYYIVYFKTQRYRYY